MEIDSSMGVPFVRSSYCEEAGSDPMLPPNAPGCESSHCVEVALGDERVDMRDSTDPEGGRLCFSRGAWGKFVGSIAVGGLAPSKAGPWKSENIVS